MKHIYFLRLADHKKLMKTASLYAVVFWGAEKPPKIGLDIKKKSSSRHLATKGKK